MDGKKQKLLLEYLISSPDVYALCKGIIHTQYFDPEFRTAADFISKYYDEYSTVPNVDQISAETDVSLKKHVITKDQIDYCSKEVEEFCKRKGLERAIRLSGTLVEEGKYGAIEQLFKDAVTISLNKDLGVNYFESPEQRLLADITHRYTTGYKPMDDLLGGGFARKEIFLLSANSGGGKSIVMANFAVNLLQQKLNVLYLTLELSEDLVSRRFDSLITGVPAVLWAQKQREIIHKLRVEKTKLGNLHVKWMPSGTTPNEIRAYLKELELKFGYVPDVLIVDYLDMMNPNQQVSADNVFEKDKRSSEQLRDILFDYNMIGITASQQNRSAIEATTLNHSHIAGGISKINTTDVYASIIFTDPMRASGEIGLMFLKTRNSDGVGKQVYLGWNNTTLRVENRKNDPTDDDKALLNRPKGPKDNNTPKRDLTDIMDI